MKRGKMMKIKRIIKKSLSISSIFVIVFLFSCTTKKSSLTECFDKYVKMENVVIDDYNRGFKYLDNFYYYDKSSNSVNLGRVIYRNDDVYFASYNQVYKHREIVFYKYNLLNKALSTLLIDKLSEQSTIAGCINNESSFFYWIKINKNDYYREYNIITNKLTEISKDVYTGSHKKSDTRYYIETKDNYSLVLSIMMMREL